MTTQRYLRKLRKNNRTVDALKGALKRQSARDTRRGHVNEKRVTTGVVTL